MPIVQDPSKLTKEKLKEELRRYNVKLPPSGAKKQAYVDLYTEHISQLNDPSIFADDFDSTDNQSVESEPHAESENESASDLEEEIDIAAGSETLPEPEKKMNVEDLSDRELAEELKGLGFKPGPIGATTRKVYEKKLIKLRLSSGGDTVLKASPKLFEQKYDEVPDDEDKQPPAKPRSPRRRPPPRRVPREDPVEEPIQEPEEQQITEDPVLTRRPLTSRHERATERAEKQKAPSSDTKSTEEKSGGIPMWLKFTIFLIVVFLVYLVIANMEPSNKIPQSITDGT